jgi:hypothetical protein
MSTIMRLVREGALKLSIYPELRHKAKKGYRYLRNVTGDIMPNVQLQDIPAPIARSKFQQLDMREYLETGKSIRFRVSKANSPDHIVQKVREWKFGRFVKVLRYSFSSYRFRGSVSRRFGNNSA